MNSFIPPHINHNDPCKKKVYKKFEPVETIVKEKDPDCEKCSVEDLLGFDKSKIKDPTKNIIELSYEPCAETLPTSGERPVNCNIKVLNAQNQEIEVDICQPDIIYDRGNVYRKRDVNVFESYYHNLSHNKPISRDCYYYAQITYELKCQGPGPSGYQNVFYHYSES